MEFRIVGGPSDGITLDLDHEAFAYAGKFGMSSTGKTVASDGELVGAVAFSEDYARDDAVRLRYVTVREDRRGEGIGSRLLRFTADSLRENYTVLIAVNNPIAYRACYRAGFVSTGTETGIAELLMRYEPDADPSVRRYRAGFSVFEDRDLPSHHQKVVANGLDGVPPEIVPVPQ